MSENYRGQTISRPSATRPQWASVIAQQDAVVSFDFSPSMAGEKARAAWAAFLAFVAALAAIVNKDGFSIGLVRFASTAQVLYALTKATQLQGMLMDPSEGAFSEGGTNITAGLEASLSLLKTSEGWGQGSRAHIRPVCVLFSDGGHNTGPEPAGAAARVKEGADLVTVAFGEDADADLLRSLATTEDHFYRCVDGADLRRFMAAVGATMTQTRAQAMNATQALSNVRTF